MNTTTHMTYTKDNESVEPWLQIKGMDASTILYFPASGEHGRRRAPDLGPEYKPARGPKLRVSRSQGGGTLESEDKTRKNKERPSHDPYSAQDVPLLA